MIKVRFLEEADIELSKAVDYYEEIHSGLGLDTLGGSPSARDYLSKIALQVFHFP